MPDTENEAKWRAEFEAVGETQLRDGVTRGTMPFPEPKRQLAFRWLREQENAKVHREQELYRYAQWTFWAAVAAAIIAFVAGLIALLAWLFPR
jgi:hypothetical protein